MLQVLELGRLPTDPSSCERLCYSFLDRARNIGGGNTPAWVRFRDRCAAWVKSILPLNRRVRHSHLELAEYNELRLANVGIVAEYALNEIIAGLDLDESFVADPMVVRYGDLAALIIAYCNDIYSYERETIQCTQFNSVELRCSNHGLSLHEAFFAQVEDIRAMVAEMVAIEDQLHSTGVLGYSQPNEEPGAARRRRHQTIYMEDIRAIVVGNHQWSLNDGRYDSLSSPFEELHHRAFLRRQDSETTAIPRY
ncbi:MAG: hypothetical protein KC501_36760 [Myxococcales bacterium]|nr:hypothetical protein [Myxococcales bacterium]